MKNTFRIKTIGAVLCLLYYINAPAQQTSPAYIDGIVAVIGDEIILKSDIENTLLEMQAAGMPTNEESRCEILSQNIKSLLLVSLAKNDTDIRVTNDMVNRQVSSILDRYRQHLGSDKNIEQFFKKDIQSVQADLVKNTRRGLYVQLLQQKKFKSIKVSPSDVRAYHKKAPKDSLPFMNTRLQVQEIVIEPRIEEYAENQVKEQLRSFRKRIQEGESFHKLAFLYSQGPSAQQGGELNYMGRAELDESFANVAFGLVPGQISRVVRSKFGYHIIELLDKKDGKIKCRHILLKPEVSDSSLQQAEDFADSILYRLRAGTITFAHAARQYSHSETSAPNEGYLINPKDFSAWFELEDLPASVSQHIASLNEGEISDPFVDIGEGTGIQSVRIVRLAKKLEGHVANVKYDFSHLSAKLKEKKQQKVVEDLLRQEVTQTYVRISPSYKRCTFLQDTWMQSKK